jgi:hypothetical protein
LIVGPEFAHQQQKPQPTEAQSDNWQHVWRRDRKGNSSTCRVCAEIPLNRASHLPKIPPIVTIFGEGAMEAAEGASFSCGLAKAQKGSYDGWKVGGHMVPPIFSNV